MKQRYYVFKYRTYPLLFDTSLRSLNQSSMEHSVAKEPEVSLKHSANTEEMLDSSQHTNTDDGWPEATRFWVLPVTFYCPPASVWSVVSHSVHTCEVDILSSISCSPVSIWFMEVCSICLQAQCLAALKCAHTGSPEKGWSFTKWLRHFTRGKWGNWTRHGCTARLQKWIASLGLISEHICWSKQKTGKQSPEHSFCQNSLTLFLCWIKDKKNHLPFIHSNSGMQCLWSLYEMFWGFLANFCSDCGVFTVLSGF